MYHSLLSPDADVECVPAIVKGARQFNATHGICGVLVFDGQRFFQYMEGPSGVIADLIIRLSKDTRHTHFTPMLHAELEGDGLFQAWSMGYAYADEGDQLSELVALKGASALAYLRQMVRQLDMA